MKEFVRQTTGRIGLKPYCLSLFAMLVAVHAFASIQIVGDSTASSDCGLNLSKISVTAKELRIPIKTKVVTGGESKFDRKSCQIVIPVAASKNQGIQIYGLTIDQGQQLLVGTQSRIQVEAFKAGSQSKSLIIQNSAKVKPLISQFKAKQKVSIILGCGTSANLRVNSSIQVQSDSGNYVSAQISNLRLSYKTIACK